MTRPLLLLAALGASATASAASCSFDTITPVSFGAYDVFSPSPLDSTGTLRVTCTSVAGADNVTVDLSAGGSGTLSRRELARAGGGTPLVYDLFVDASRTVRWGDGADGTGHYGPANPPDGTPFDLPVYGRVPAVQDVAAGSFSDTVVATINF